MKLEQIYFTSQSICCGGVVYSGYKHFLNLWWPALSNIKNDLCVCVCTLVLHSESKLYMCFTFAFTFANILQWNPSAFYITMFKFPAEIKLFNLNSVSVDWCYTTYIASKIYNERINDVMLTANRGISLGGLFTDRKLIYSKTKSRSNNYPTPWILHGLCTLPGRTGLPTLSDPHPGRWQTSPRTGSRSWLFLPQDLASLQPGRWLCPCGASPHDPPRTCAHKTAGGSVEQPINEGTPVGALTAVWSRDPRRSQPPLTWWTSDCDDRQQSCQKGQDEAECEPGCGLAEAQMKGFHFRFSFAF